GESRVGPREALGQLGGTHELLHEPVAVDEGRRDGEPDDEHRCSEQHDRVHHEEEAHARSEREDADDEATPQRRGPLASAVTESREERARREDGEDRSGGTLLAVLLGEGDGRDVGRTEDRTDADEDERDGDEPRGAQHRSLALDGATARGWLALALGEEEQPAAGDREPNKDESGLRGDRRRED